MGLILGFGMIVFDHSIFYVVLFQDCFNVSQRESGMFQKLQEENSQLK